LTLVGDLHNILTNVAMLYFLIKRNMIYGTASALGAITLPPHRYEDMIYDDIWLQDRCILKLHILA